MIQIFISYAREDKTRIKPLVHTLEKQGWSIFWDQRIPAGQTWHSYIGKALNNASCVIVAWSHHSISSDWVREEADEGKKRNILVPILLDSVEPPIGFRSIQAADLSNWPSERASSQFEHLLNDISEILKTSPAEKHVNQQQPVETSNSTSINVKFISLISFGWAIAWAIGWAIGGAIGGAIVWAIAWAIGGAIGGLATGYALKQIEPSIQRKQIVIVTVGWTIAVAVGGAIARAIDWTIGGTIGGAIGGLATGYALKQIEPSIQRKQIIIVTMGWTIAMTIGRAIGVAIIGGTGGVIAWAMGGAIGGAITGAIAGAVMIWCLEPIRQ